jgi:hypothetical protein
VQLGWQGRKCVVVTFLWWFPFAAVAQALASDLFMLLILLFCRARYIVQCSSASLICARLWKPLALHMPSSFSLLGVNLVQSTRDVYWHFAQDLGSYKVLLLSHLLPREVSFTHFGVHNDGVIARCQG